MIELSNTQAQALTTDASGNTLSFDRIILHTGCGECFNEQVNTSVKLCGKGVYELHFNGNITGATAGAPIQLSLAIGGSVLTETAMNAVPAAANDLVNVSTSTLLKNCCCDLDRVSVVNSGANPLTVAPNSNFYIVRKS